MGLRCQFIICYVALFVVIARVDAISSEDKEKIREAMKPYVTKCIEEFGVSEEKVREMEKKGSADDGDSCLIACIFQKSGIINKGVFDVKKTIEMTKPFITNEEDIEAIEKVAHICAKVNDEEVSDDDKGCDRSKLLFACMMEHKDEVNLKGE